ncbi:MAG: AMP-binding protein, partial [Bifidobacteriaceae bacterium]|nr:AMP-binding protein [Bifidobacteriaceae bacterium]
MKSFTCPPAIPPDPSLTVPRLLRARVDRDPTATLVEVDDGGTWLPLSAAEALDRVNLLARGLMAAGVLTGDRVGIMGRTSWAWAQIDLALATIGAVSVPVYETSSVEQIAWIGMDAGLTGIFVESSAHRASVEAAQGDVPTLQHIWTIEDGVLDELATAGQAIEPSRVAARSDALTGDDLATVIYTSGTTGRPKGVELTHTNICVPAVNAAAALYFICGPESRLLQFLPLAHVFARQINFIALAGWSVIGYVPSTANLVEDLDAFKPTFVLVVPRVLEKVYNGAEQATGGGLKQRIFRLAAKIAIVSSRELDARGGLTLVRQMQHRVCRALVYRKLQATLGGALTLAVSGGAPLGERLG